MRRLLLFCTLAILLAAGALRFARKAPRLPNVLIVTLDTVRADHVGRDKGTPAIEAFLEQATHFRCARTTVPLTLAAHVSLFSGLLPAHHGVHDNATPCGKPESGRSYALLTEQFRERGFRTAAFLASPVLASQTGLDAGFDHYSCPAEGHPSLGERGYLQAEVRSRAAISWMKAAPRTQPWMVWVHLYDAHGPYEAWEGDVRRAGVAPSASIQERYDGEVRRVDAAVGRLLEAAGPETIVVLVSDHGEGLGDHGEMTHGWLCHASSVDIFLAVRGPGLERGGVDSGPRSIIDVAPTLRQWCGLPPTDDDGLPLSGPAHEVVLSESLRAWRIHNLGQCFAACDGRFTLIESGHSLEMFDRAADPLEGNALDPLGQAAYERLDRATQRMRAVEQATVAAQPILETVSPYNALRRPDTAYLASFENAGYEDPRDQLPRMDELAGMPNQVELGIRTRNQQMLHRVIERSRQLATELPTSACPHECQALAAAAIARIRGDPGYWLEAAGAMIRVVELGHDSWEILAAGLEFAVRSGSAERIARLVDLALTRESQLPPDLLERCRRAAKQVPGRSGRELRDRIP